jgi:hypothetical protein
MSGGHVTRPTDWWVLDLERDPTPGSPTEVRRMARRWHEVSEDAAWAAQRMSQLMGDGVVGRWIGEAGDVFRARSGELPGQLAKCADSYGQAADALSWWADRLDAHQADADSALARGRVARDDLERALADARRAAEQVASSALVPALVGPSLLPSPEQVHDAQARLASAKAARSQADAAVADAESRLEAARRLALDALELRERDGRTTAARIHEAADAGIPERSRWDKLKDWADEAWHVVVEVAKVTVAVLGVVALLIGGPLAWVVLAAAVVLLADAIRRWMQGEAALWEVGLAALGCIPGTRGLLTSGARAVAGMARGTRTGTVVLRTDRVVITTDGIARPTSVVQGALLTEHLRQLSQYGLAGFRVLESGRIRYYALVESAKVPGVMQGRRIVREWDPATGARRTWHETIDQTGRVRQVRPQQEGPKRHFRFDAEGRYEGSW